MAQFSMEIMRLTGSVPRGNQQAKIEIEIAKSDLAAFNSDPGSYAIEPSRRKGVRGFYTLLSIASDVAVDLEKEAPAYTELRDRFISGKIDFETFKKLVTDRYPITLDLADDRIIIGEVTGDEVL